MKVILLILFTSSFIFAQSKEENVITREFGKFSFSVDAANGGRIVSLKYDNIEFLTGKNIHPDNYGSTLWPSPQSLWNWPPPGILDADEYESLLSEDKIHLQSKKDEHLGLQFLKTFSLNTDTSLMIIYKITNISDSDIEVAPWEITRMPKGGIVCFPKGETEPKAKTFDPIPYSQTGGILWYQNNDEVLPNHLLSVSDGSEGWLAYIMNGYIYLKIFEDVPLSKQFRGEGEIPIYVSPSSPYVEIEAQGPKNNLKAGDSLEWKMKWIIRKLPEQIIQGYENYQVVSFIHTLIK